MNFVLFIKLVLSCLCDIIKYNLRALESIWVLKGWLREIVCHPILSFKLYTGIQKIRRNTISWTNYILYIVFVVVFTLFVAITDYLYSSISIPSFSNLIVLEKGSTGIMQTIFSFILSLLNIIYLIVLLIVYILPFFSAIFFVISISVIPIVIIQVVKYIPFGGLLSIGISVLNRCLLKRFDYPLYFLNIIGGFSHYKNTSYSAVSVAIVHFIEFICNFPIIILVFSLVITNLDFMLQRVSHGIDLSVPASEKDVQQWLNVVSESKMSNLFVKYTRDKNISSSSKSVGSNRQKKRNKNIRNENRKRRRKERKKKK